MPSIKFKHFDQYRASGVLKGIFLGGCVERGDGSSFRRKAHAHNHPEDPNFGWICIRSRHRLMTDTGNPGNTMLHELAHLLVPKQGHTDKWRSMLRSLGGKVLGGSKKGIRGHRHAWKLVQERDRQQIYRCACTARRVFYRAVASV